MISKQSKLSKDEKESVREFMRDFRNAGGFVFSFPEERVTIAIARDFPGATFARVGVAHAADSETKFRKLYGAMLAMERTDEGLGFAARIAEGTEHAFAEKLVALMDYYSL